MGTSTPERSHERPGDGESPGVCTGRRSPRSRRRSRGHRGVDPTAGARTSGRPCRQGGWYRGPGSSARTSSLRGRRPTGRHRRRRMACTARYPRAGRPARDGARDPRAVARAATCSTARSRPPPTARVGLLRRPAHGQRHAGHPPRGGARLQGRVPPLPDDEGLPRPPQGRAGTATACRSSSRWRRSSASPASGHRGLRRRASSTPDAGSRCCATSTSSPTMTERMGYWVDMDQAYWTMDPDYVESVWWSLKQIFDKGLLVQDHRVTPYCPRCGTGLSDHELAQGYETVVDPSVYVRFPVDRRAARRAAPRARRCWCGPRRRGRWCPTPPSRCSADASYVVARTGTGEVLVVAEALLADALGDDARCWSGSPAATWSTPPTAGRSSWSPVPDAHYVILGDFVTTDDGSGLVHIAPAFGADDLARGTRVRPAGRQPGPPRRALRGRRPAGRAGCSSRRPTTRWSRDLRRARPALQARAATSTPTRTAGAATPRSSTTRSRPGTSARRPSRTPCCGRTRRTNWFPGTIQWGRYGDWLQQQRRLGAVPQPLLGHPAADLALRRRPSRRASGRWPSWRALAGRDLTSLDPHRPFVDDVTFPCPDCGREAHRVPEVIDGWYDSGSMPFAQWGFPHRGPGAVRVPLPGRLHLRGDRPDPRLVLHADGRRHAGLRPLLLPERGLPRATSSTTRAAR